ncbi:MAG: MFS transporter [Candidatus Diapherotrites archaeon]
MNGLRLAYAINFCRKAFLFSTYFFLPLYFLSLGFDGLQIGVLFAAYAIPSLFFTFPTGLFNDRFTVRNLLFLGLLLLLLHYLGLAFTSSFTLLCVLLFIGGMGSNISDTSISSFVLKKVEQKKGREFSVYTSANFLGAGAGFLLGGFLLQFLPFTSVFLLMAALYFILLFSVVLLPEAKVQRESLAEYKGDLFNRNVIVLALVYFLFTLHWGAERIAFTPFLRENLGLDFFQSALYMAAGIIAIVPFVLWAGKKIDSSQKPRNFLFAAILLSAIGHIAMTIPMPLVSVFFRGVHEIGDALFDLTILLGFSRLFLNARIGGNSSAIFLIGTIGMFVGSLLFGPIAEQFGYAAPLIISGVISLAALLIALLGMKWFNEKTG